MTAMTARRRMIAPMLVTVALLALAACSGETASGEVTTAGGNAAADSSETNGSGGSGDESEPDDQGVAFAECMRDQGIEMADPAPGENGLRTSLREVADTYDEDTMAAAFEACEHLYPTQQHDRRQVDQETQLALAECLRDQGLDVSDDLFGAGLPEGVSREQWMSATQECRDMTGAQQ